MSSNPNNKGKGGGQGPRKRGFIFGAILWALVLVIFFNFLAKQIANAGTKEVPYSEFIQMVEEDKVATVELTSNKYTFYLKEDLPAGAGEGGSQDLAEVLAQQMEQGGATRYVTAPVVARDDSLISLLKEHDVEYYSPMQEESSYLMSLLLSYVVPMILMVGLLVFLMRRMSGGMGGLGGVGKANAKVYMEKSTGVTFADVAGQDEAKESLVEIIDFLHNPGKYTEIGAKLPKGALLVGPPGTGKTLLAKAVAGEANVPFFSISGSDFVEMFVGVGASRVRDLFKEANKVAPCIVFIDEIDTIGKSRDNRMGGNDEREQTLNQLLAEMDGFDPTKGVILLAATNRPEVLDQALLRPGRFDRRITIDRPNLAGRLATLQVHTRRIRLSEDVDLRKVALATAGCVGADLANLVNEAALRAVRLGRRAVNQQDLLSAFELVIAGTEKKGSVLTEFEKKLVAYHEVGHAMVAYKQKNTEPVQKITIVPHTQGSLGYTLLMPEEDKTELRTRDELLARIAVSMGGQGRGGSGAEHHDQRRGPGHPGRHCRGPEHGGHVRHERPLWHDGSGLQAQPVLGRGLRHGLRPGHRRRPGRGGPGHPGPVLRHGGGDHPGEPGGDGPGGGLPAGEGDHHRRGDGGHHPGPGPRHGGLPPAGPGPRDPRRGGRVPGGSLCPRAPAGGRRPGGGTASRPRGDTEGVTRPGHPSKEQAPPGNDTRAGLF